MDSLSFWRFAEEFPSTPALTNAQGEALSAGQLLARTHQTVHALRSLGLQRGEVVTALLENDFTMIELYLAAAQAGWYFTPINSHLTAGEIAYILEDSGTRALICSERYAALARAAVQRAGLPPDTVLCDRPVEGLADWSALRNAQSLEAPTERWAGVTMTYTSGTTGRPKGVRRPLPALAPEVLADRLARFPMLFGISPRNDGVHLVVSPLYHTAVLSFASNHLHLGHSVVLMDRWTPEGMLDAIQRYRVTSSHMVPTQFHRLLSLPEAVRSRYDLSSLRNMIHGAAPCPLETKRRMLEWWGPVLYEYYAAAEGGGAIIGPEEWLERPGSVGRAWPGAELRILDDDGQPAPTGSTGTVYIRMPTSTFEYHRDRQKTDKAWKDGFFTVGDAGFMDAAGYLFLCDRKADMVISGGVNIYPAEIEGVLHAHPAVADVAVFGIPDSDWGEQLKAVVQPARETHGDTETEARLREELLAYCRTHLAGYKVPRSLDFMEALPRDPNGKLYKRRLRDPYWEGHTRAI